MKHVLLIGDSIRMGYDQYVKLSLEGSAEVWYPEENCRFTQYVLRYLHEWVEKSGGEVDCLHWNAGLWDCLNLFEDGPATPLGTYRMYIDRICRRIRTVIPNAKVIFATSTPVDEKGNTPTFARHNEVIRQFNAAAVEALSSTDTIIDDLYAVAERFPAEYRSDVVHFYTPQATEQLGGKVLSVICDCLDIAPEALCLEHKEFVVPSAKIAQM